jgi:hypothetical protein
MPLSFRIARLPGWVASTLDRRGPDLRRWPAAERAALQRRLRRAPWLRTELLRQMEADPSLTAEAASVTPDIAGRMAAAVARGVAATMPPTPHTAHAGGMPMGLLRLGSLGGSLAACAALGIWLGWVSTSTAPQPTLLATAQSTLMADDAP